jgi:PTS system nitrogen regulatory IIA component
MQLQSILTPERTFVGATATSKKRAIQAISGMLAEQIPQFDEEEIYDALLSREKLGSTAIGEGIAIPHSRIDNCIKITGALVKLADPVDFDAPDSKPVDLVFVLLVPSESTEEHLGVLSELATLFSDPGFTSALRQANNPDALFQTAIDKGAALLGQH